MNYFCPINQLELAIKEQNDWPTPLRINNQDYCFLHLSSYDHVATRPATNHRPSLVINIRIVFDCHVATKEISPPFPAISAHNSHHFWVDRGGRMRLFNSDRYAESLQLRAVLQEVFDGKRKCYRGGKNNSFIWNRVAANGVSENYQIYFTITKNSLGGVLMYIQSAFVRHGPTYEPRNDETFIALCIKALNHKR